MGYSITLEDIDFLLTDEGQSYLNKLALTDLSYSNRLSVIENLRKNLTMEQASAIVETVRLRQKGKEKFSRAHLMYFLEDGLEQATGEVISKYRAGKFARYSKVADLTCGIGGDLFSMAEVCSRVIAVDIDPVRLKIAKTNALVLGLSEKIDFFQADLRQKWPVEAAFIDPSRRIKGKRVFKVNSAEPPLKDVLKFLSHIPHMGIKTLPGIKYEEVPHDCEIEFISHNGICKEAVLWFGDLKENNMKFNSPFSRSVTILPEEIKIKDTPVDPVAEGQPLAYIYEPDPAIIRAHMVEWAAEKLQARKLDRDIAYLTGDKFHKTPFAKVWKLEEAMPFNLKNLNKKIKELRIGEAVIKKRGTAVEPEMLRKKLRLVKKGKKAVIFLTSVCGRQMILFCSDLELS